MQTPVSSNSRAARSRTLALLVLLLVSAGAILLLRHTSRGRLGTAAALPEVARTNLVLVEGRLRQTGGPIPFAGFMVEHYADGTLRSRSTISNGLLHGLSQGWHTNAQLQVSEHFQQGISHGLRTKWYPAGAKQSEATIVDGKLNGPFRQWHENGALSQQVDFADDQPKGLSLAYFPSRYLKARVVMQDGQPIEQEFWKDGEKKE